jgi:hypothetical protein
MAYWIFHFFFVTFRFVSFRTLQVPQIYRSLPWFFCINKLNHLYCLNKTFFSHSYLPIDYNCFVNQLYHETKIICKERVTCKKTLISLCIRGRASSADIGRVFCLVWWALIIQKTYIQCTTICIYLLQIFFMLLKIIDCYFLVFLLYFNRLCLAVVKILTLSPHPTEK